jgi:hypothetical protein
VHNHLPLCFLSLSLSPVSFHFDFEAVWIRKEFQDDVIPHFAGHLDCGHTFGTCEIWIRTIAEERKGEAKREREREKRSVTNGE